MNCDIKVISPVHIGSGEKYGASEYLYFNPNPSNSNNFAFKRININKYYKYLLSLNNKTEEDKFLEFLSNPEFCFSEYKSNVSKTFTRYTLRDNCKNTPSRNEIEEVIKTFDKAYIPGSSIKGAIKTSILFHLMDFDDIYDINNFIHTIDNDKKFNINQNNFFDNFITSNLRKDNNGRNISAPQRNIFKFLQVSDSSFAKQISLNDYYIKMASINNNRKSNNIFKKNNDGILYLETIDRGSNLSFEINNNFDEKFYSKLKFNENITELINIDNIKSYIYDFSNEIIESEMKFSEEYDFKGLYKFYSKNKKYNKEKTPLLRVGFGSGFLATSIGLKIREYDDYMYSKIIDYKDAYDFCFPKSRKITRKDEMPLGWIQLKFNE